MIQPKPHSKDLRKGRYSEANRIYLITTVTRERMPVFEDFKAARTLVYFLRQAQLRSEAETLAYVIMPDHCHWLMQLGESKSLSSVVGNIKSLTARQLKGVIWQAGYHDHAVRREEDLQAIARYIVANPLRKGLVEQIGDYPHWDAKWL